MNSVYRLIRWSWCVMACLLMAAAPVLAQDKVYPDKPNPPRLVNDFAHLLSAAEVQNLEQKLEDYANSSSIQITVVTMSNLGGNDISEYSVHVFNDWGLGQEKKNNGVLILVALDDGFGKRKAWITVGNGLQGVLTDVKSGQIFRNQMVPAFKEKNYYKGLSDAADAVIAVTKGEYTSEAGDRRGDREGRHGKKSKGAPVILIVIIFIIIIFALRSRGGGGGRGGRGGGGDGLADLATGIIIGNLLSGGRRGGGDWGGGGSGGFGGFGGGSTDGGGAGGSW